MLWVGPSKPTAPRKTPTGNRVGARGFEPPTPWSRTRCATRLRYAPRRTRYLPRPPFSVKEILTPPHITSPALDAPRLGYRAAVLRPSLALAAVSLACSADPAPPAAPTVAMDFRADAPFFAAPFPSEHRRAATGYRLEALPAAAPSAYLQGILALAQAADGFATTGGVFLTTTAPLDVTSLPDLAASVTPVASVFLTPVEGPGAGTARVPVRVTFHAADAPSRTPNLLAAIPLQGAPLDAARTYAFVVTQRVRTAAGALLAPSPALASLRASTALPGLDGAAATRYRDALRALEAAGVRDIAGLAVFRTGAPTASFERRVTSARSSAPIRVTTTPAARETFDDFCVYEAALDLPSWQEGAAPYATEGGRWGADDAAPHSEPSRLVVTLPRRTMPAAGFPVVVFIRTGGGGDRPLVDRGVRGRDGMVLVPGTGPAREFAREGFAGASWDGPHGGVRNVSRGDEQFLMFNVSNLGALRDNVRQSALEAVLLVDALRDLRIDTSACAGLTAPDNSARLDPSLMALMGHSMGASIAPLAVAFEPRYRALLLSGAGASWIENVVHKQRPIAIRPFAEALLRYNGTGARLDVDDPSLTMLQWALEAADVAPFAARAASGRHVFMTQGIVDHYILPPIANAASLSLGLDLAGPSLDAADPRLMAFDPLARLLPLRGLTAHLGAVAQNREGFTRVVRQYREDGVEDGHEVTFQTDAAKRDYRCFLRGLTRGAPSVPAPEAGDCAP